MIPALDCYSITFHEGQKWESYQSCSLFDQHGWSCPYGILWKCRPYRSRSDGLVSCQQDNQIAFMDMLTKEFNNNNPFGIKITVFPQVLYGRSSPNSSTWSRRTSGYGHRMPNQLAFVQHAWAESLIDMNDLVKSKWAMHPETMADIPDSFLAQDISSDFGNARLILQDVPANYCMPIWTGWKNWVMTILVKTSEPQPVRLRTTFSGSKDLPQNRSAEIGTDASPWFSNPAHGGETLDKSKGAYVFDNARLCRPPSWFLKCRKRLSAFRYRKIRRANGFRNGVALFTTGSSSDFPITAKPSPRVLISIGPFTCTAYPGTERKSLWSFICRHQKSDKRKQVAVWLWLREFLKPVNRAQFVRLTNYVPVRLSTMNLLDDYRKKSAIRYHPGTDENCRIRRLLLLRMKK